MKTYIVQFDEERITKGIEEIAKVANVKPEEFIAGVVALQVAPNSKTAQKLHPEHAS